MPVVNRKGSGEHTQSVLFKKSRWTEARAISWLKNHKYRTDGYDEGDQHHRFRQVDPEPNKFRYRNKVVGEGITLVLGFPRGSKAKASSMSKKILSNLSIVADLQIEAAGGDQKQTKFILTASTGKPMQLEGFFSPVLIDLSGAKFAHDPTPVIMDHDSAKRIGHTTKQEVQAKRIYAEGVVSSQMGVARGFVDDAKAGFPFQVSVGAIIKKGSYIEKGDKATVNGKEWEGPIIVSHKTLIRELSITVLAADSSTSVRIAATNPQRGDTTMSTSEFNAWVKDLHLDLEELSDEQLNALRKAHEAQVEAQVEAQAEAAAEAAAEAGSDDLTRRRKVEAAETERIDSINALAKQYSEVESVTYDGKKVSLPALKAMAIREGWAPDTFELPLLRNSRPSATQFKGIHSRGSLEGELYAQALGVSLCRQLGVAAKSVNRMTGEEYGYEAWYPEKALEASHDRQVSRPTVGQLIDLSISAAGLSYSGNRKDNDYIRTASLADRQLRAHETYSTMAASNILEDVANKTLLAAYQAQETVWSMIAAVKTLNDFKAHNFYRLDVHGSYTKVGPDGRLSHGTFGDAKYSVQGDTYGMILTLSRRDIINDDLNAFAQISSGLGRHSAIAIEEAVLDLLLTNRATFPAVTTNVDLDIDGISEAEQLFRDMLDDGKKPILVSPSRLLVGSQDAVQARDLYESETLIAVGVGNSAARDFDRNPHKGKYQAIVSPYLSNDAIRKQDGTAMANQDSDQWFLFGNPAVVAALLVGFLQGKQVPVIESDDTSFDTLGIQYRSYHDWGVGAGDTNGCVFSPGA